MHILYMHINMALRNKMTLKNAVAHTHTLYILYICMVKPHIKNLKSHVDFYDTLMLLCLSEA